MRNLLIILATFLFALSCKKECNKEKTPNGNNLNGKIKSIVEHTGRDTLYFSFKYDSITTELKEVRLIPLNRLDTFYTLMTLDKINDSCIFIDYYVQSIDEKYKIIINGNQIKTIYKLDTIEGMYNQVCKINTNSNGLTDSIYDEGFLSIFYFNINYVNFIYSNENCIKYKHYWTEQVTGLPIYKSEEDSFTFTSIANTHKFPIQDLYFGGSVISWLSYYLQVGGYYYIQPNKYLIEKIITNDHNIPSIYTTKFDYTLRENYVTRLQITMPDGGINFRDIAYY